MGDSGTLRNLDACQLSADMQHLSVTVCYARLWHFCLVFKICLNMPIN